MSPSHRSATLHAPPATEMRALVPFVLATLILSARPIPAERSCHACICTTPTTLRAALRSADAVLRARVVAVDALPPDAGGAWVSAWPEGRRIRLEVTRVWKGQLSEPAEVFTGFGHGDCGYPFEPDREYLIFARRVASGRLVTAVCTGTQLAGEAVSNLAALGPGRLPSVAPDSVHRPHN